MHKRNWPAIFDGEVTPDGFQEVWVEVGGQEVGRTVYDATSPNEAGYIYLTWAFDLIRKHS